MKKIVAFIKKETVLTVAWILAIISAVFVHPSYGYIEYIDFRSLGILWSLMIIMSGLKKEGFFNKVAIVLLDKAKRVWQLGLILVMLCFVFSMIITNDVALITFVPFTIYILGNCKKEELLIPIIVLQTLAANLGSMLTPVGNPQNLYLYGLSEMKLGEFIGVMLPYTIMSLVLILLSLLLIKDKNDIIESNVDSAEAEKKLNISLYGILTLVSLLVVGRFIQYYILVLLVLIIVLIIDKKVLLSIDYALLFTFIGFFIFTGNLGKIQAISNYLTSLVCNREVAIGVLSSQVISNVPAALLLSAFTDNYKDLIIGVNLGGLGTLIASMASLISFKSLAHNYNDKKGRYLFVFTITNIIYLVILVGFYCLIR